MGPGIETESPRRSRWWTRARVLLAAGTLCAVAGVTALVWEPWVDGDPGRRDAGPVLVPASRTYPVLPDPYGDRYDAKLSPTLIRERQAFRQRVADVVQRHLPPGAAMAISELSFGDYRVTIDRNEYAITLYIDPIRPVRKPPKGVVTTMRSDSTPGLRPRQSIDRYDPRCKASPPRPPGLGCVDGALPNGEYAAVYFPEKADVPDSRPGTTGPSASFRYRNATVQLTVRTQEKSRAFPPIAGEQWLGVVTDRDFIELVDYCRAHPKLKGNGW